MSGAAENDHGDRGEQVRFAHVVVGLRCEAGQKNADQRRAEAAEHIGGEDDADPSDTPESRAAQALLPTATQTASEERSD